MQNSLTLPSIRQVQGQDRPCLTSYDCGPECSLEHFVEVSCLVEAEEDSPTGHDFSHRWLSWAIEEEELVSGSSPVFYESSTPCLVA